MHRLHLLAFQAIVFFAAAGTVRAQSGLGPPEAGAPEIAHETGHAAGGAHHAEVSGWPFFLIQAVGFVLLAIVFAKYAWPPLRKGLDGRAERVQGGFQKAESEDREAQRLLTETLDRSHGFSVEAQRRRDEAVRQGRTLRAQIESEAHGLAEQTRQKARREAELERKVALAEIRQEVIERAFAEAANALRRRVDDRLHGTLVDRYVDELQGMPALF